MLNENIAGVSREELVTRARKLFLLRRSYIAANAYLFFNPNGSF